MTLSYGILATTLSISSEIPSEKYSCSLSDDILTNGRTAIDVLSDSWETSFEGIYQILGSFLLLHFEQSSQKGGVSCGLKLLLYRTL